MTDPKITDRELFDTLKKAAAGKITLTPEQQAKLTDAVDVEMDSPEALKENVPTEETGDSHWQKKQKVKTKNPIVSDWRSKRPKESRQVTHNLRRRMGR
jgi:hypothetical protein